MARRDLLRGGILSFLGGAACSRQPTEDLIPYVETPPEEIPGRPTTYATTISRHGYALGVLAQCYGGRPVKLEGHPEHPSSLGALDALGQALLHELYDPARVSSSRAAQPSTWTTFLSDWRAFSETPVLSNGRGLCVLVEPTSSLIQLAALAQLSERYPEARFFVDDLTLPMASQRAARRAFGTRAVPAVDFGNVRAVLCIDDDAFVGRPESLCWARKWGPALGARDARDKARLFVAEPVLTSTGLLADERLASTRSECGALLLEIYRHLSTRLAPDSVARPPALGESLLDSRHRRWARKVSDELSRQPSHSWVTVGPHQPESVHILGFAVNRLLRQGLVGYPNPRLEPGDPRIPTGSAHDLLLELRSGRAKALISLADNPWYSWPERDEFTKLLTRVPFSVQCGLYHNETAQQTKHFVRRAHELEIFDAIRSLDGSVSLSQPLVRPLIRATSPSQLLLRLSGRRIDDKAFLNDVVRSKLGDKVDLDDLLRRGVVPDSAAPLSSLEPKPDVVAQAAQRIAQQTSPPAVELLIREEPKLDGGRHANNDILQELPDPVTKVVWDNVLLVHPKTGRQKELSHGGGARIVGARGSIELAVLFEPSQVPGVLSTTVGYGRNNPAEPTAHGVGVDVEPLRTLASPFSSVDFDVKPSNFRRELARTQHEFSDHERGAALLFSVDEFEKDPGLVKRHAEPPKSILPTRSSDVRKWGMSIDLSACMGCNACVVACQVENSVPTVGPKQARLGRTMHWLRIDRYEKKRFGRTVSVSQPMACQHCEKAPCEYVCPVGATTHSPDGLNEMTYNRCVGTRYCSNNCPYKVRRFNYLSYDEGLSPTRQMEKNPNVSVRSRGVMEKCTYCVQRIRRAEIDARLAGRPRSSAQVVTACQQTCPTQAIRFGAASDPKSEVSRKSSGPRAYSALNELGARPRTRYLAKIAQPFPHERSSGEEDG